MPASFPICEERIHAAASCRMEEDKRRSLAAAYLMGKFYEQATGKDPAGMRLSYNSKGKPYFQDYPGVCFNLSHAGDVVFGALSDKEIGVDMERADRKILALSDHAYTKADRRHIEESEDPLMPIKIWVIRESIAKAMGLGLSAMTDFELMWFSEDSGITWGGAYTFHLLKDAPEGYIACISERTGK